MGLRPVSGDVALPLAARTTGTHTGSPVTAAGYAADVVLTVHCTAASGTPTLDCSLEESGNGTDWTAVPGSGTAQLTGVGNRIAAATITRPYVRVTSTVAGTTPSVTYRAVLLVVPE
ncbi:hypothetical protein B4N89_13495 [Embleya scabrispora]|uniref:Uncharacterized protein n=1 Tax=Embleya scabrispora TaxID=159449 RepID=A0A1T3NYK0_9ACTN|nr:hypothetical protein [Embleya scabrispora]OPC81815.1 hypothetical protein B4N89_13495 [Embleya scabrispora]